MDSKAVANKPHAVFVPAPAQSHIKAMIKLAKLVHRKGFHITFVNTEFNHQRFLKSRGPKSLDGLPDFCFQTIPDGLPPSNIDATQDVPALSASIKTNFLIPFKQLVAKLNDTVSSNVPPVSCIVSDGFMMFTTDAAEELGIPDFKFFTISAYGFMACKMLRLLKDKGLTPLKDESYLTNGYLDTVLDWIPGMKDIRLRDLISFLRTTDPNDIMFNFTMEAAELASKASAIVVHTFEALESEVLSALSTMFPNRVYAIGPLQLLLNQIQEDDLKSIGYNLWKEETECLQWLDSKQPKSVIYVNFGSVASMAAEQLIEFGMGLANSNHYFLWIIRPDLVVGEAAVLPAEFSEPAKRKGLMASWCPQEQVLNHTSVGGFITHSGWNSTIESLSAGVPMLCWPDVGDQQTNCRYTCNEWGVGMEIDNDVKREHVEELVIELMEGEKGKEMRNKAIEWKKLAAEATGPSGSSTMNLDRLVKELVLLSRA